MIARQVKKFLMIGLLVQMVVATNLATSAQAEMISTDSAIMALAADADRQSLLNEFSKEDVRVEMQKLGVDPAEAEARLAAMSDEEVAVALAQIDEGTAGGDIVGALLTVFLILLLTDILCLTDVFPFTRCSR